jgi:hypothetical protein
VVSSQLHTPAALSPRERVPNTHWIRSWWAPEPVSIEWRREKYLVPVRNGILILIIQLYSPQPITILTELSQLPRRKRIRNKKLVFEGTYIPWKIN